MMYNSEKPENVNPDIETASKPENEKTPAGDIKEAPLAPFDPRLKKPGEGPLQANEDPLNGVNE